MRFVQKLRDFAVKLLNLRIVDKRFRKTTLILVDKKALSLDHQPISVTYDYSNDRLEYNLHTAVGLRVNNPKDVWKYTNPS